MLDVQIGHRYRTILLSVQPMYVWGGVAQLVEFIWLGAFTVAVRFAFHI